MLDQVLSRPQSSDHPACRNEARMLRLARRYGVSVNQIEELCRRVGHGRDALEAALAMMARCAV